MVVSSPSGQWRDIGWNSLQFRCPASWEVIVAGPRHLLIEENLAPVFEWRWAANVTDDSMDKLLGRADSDNLPPLLPVKLPPSLSTLSPIKLTSFSRRYDKRPEILLGRCDSCKTVLLGHIHKHSGNSEADIHTMLSTVRCHLPQSSGTFWSLQDFRLSLPATYTFQDSSFQAGLSRLAFTGQGLRLQFCRLASAATRLAGRRLKDLLGDLTGSPFIPRYLVDREDCCECIAEPEGLKKLLATFSGKPRCCWARIWHVPEHDRLLALVISARRPPDPQHGNTLAQGYETFSLI